VLELTEQGEQVPLHIVDVDGGSDGDDAMRREPHPGGRLVVQR